MEIAILGHMGRDEAVADRLASEGHTLHIIGQWNNPGLLEKAETNGGAYHVIPSLVRAEAVADIVHETQPDMFLTNSDDALAAGVVDAIRDRNGGTDILLPCPDTAASQVEWDKFYLREIIDEINPVYNPRGFRIDKPEDVDEAISFFASQGIEIVVKPRNLTGGKGVKVMGKHFNSFAEGKAYAFEVLGTNNQSGVEIQQKLEGVEFNLQLITDGVRVIEPPVTHDYPYREDGDAGPGTGGMGTFTMADGLQPFLAQDDYGEAVELSRQVLAKMQERGIDYKGVLYPNFIKSPTGLMMVEINARGGDPELINITDLMEDDIDLGSTLRSIAVGELAVSDVRYKKLASTVIYLVPPDHGYRAGRPVDFNMNRAAIAANDCSVRFAATELVSENWYSTVGSSRTLALSALGATPWEARAKIHTAINEAFDSSLPLHYRRDVGAQAYIESLS